MALSSEKIAELRSIIHEQLSRTNIQGKIRDVIVDTVNAKQASGDKHEIAEEKLIKDLRETGIVNEIMSKLHFESPVVAPYTKPSTHDVKEEAKSKPEAKVAVDPTRRYLYFQMTGGKAFIEHITEDDYSSDDDMSAFTVHVMFQNQRFSSRPAPVACEPRIFDGFLLELVHNSAEHGQKPDAKDILTTHEPIYLSVVKTGVDGTTTLFGTYVLEWRKVLASQSLSVNVSMEVMGIGSGSKIPVGILNGKLEVIPRENVQVLSRDLVNAQLDLEQKRNLEKEQIFLVYAKRWWDEYLQIKEEHKNRTVKIFAQSESGKSVPVCVFVKPLRAGRLIQTPLHAARFVSVLKHEQLMSIGSNTNCDQWLSSHSFVCTKKGSHEEHSNLLCSLLLGFGLESYVAVGTKSNGRGYTWVVTRYVAKDKVVFWDAVLGRRYVHKRVFANDPPAFKQPTNDHPFSTIGCMYNHTNFFANVQPNDKVEQCGFDVNDSAFWKKMSTDALKSMTCHRIPIPPLLAPTIDYDVLSNKMESTIRNLVIEHRMDMDLSTCWDNHLSYVLSMALYAYENERSNGGEPTSGGNEEFQEAVKNAIPDGHTFKGFPVQFLHHNARKAFASCLRNPVCLEIVNCRGDNVRLAVRVNVVVFPENAVAMWVMFACKYRSIL